MSFLRRQRLNSNRDFCRFFSWGARILGGFKIRIQDRHNLNESQPCVYVANHQSGFDVVTFGALFPRRTLAVGKKEVIWIPFFNLIFLCGGNVLLDRSRRMRAVEKLRSIASVLKKNQASVWIFPEGTRNRTYNGLLPFKKGAFHLAIETGLPIVPVVSSSLSDIFRQPKMFFRGGKVTLRVLPPIPTAGLKASDADRLSEMTRTQMAVAFQELATG